MLQGAGAALAGAAFSTRVMAAAPPPETVTPALIEAAKAALI
jgi:iron(III) transport system substrate-binding protein